MTHSEAAIKYGATHYLPSVDDPSTAMLYYKRKSEQWNDGSSTNDWHYLSFASIWFPSAGIEASDLVEIPDER